ncbi:hypothetical protein [Segatella oulorum]|uniref:hypothetical protein n=1 Tax=Segatella oulorum TaxID=28136 RepID=UPI0028E8385F|nr:hypothetical protein [Segatella oulorum]
MKIGYIFRFAIGITTLFLAGCSANEGINPTNGDGKIILDGSHFKFTEETFNADQTLTRAANAAGTPQTTISLGNGLEADISVEYDKASAVTRATQPLRDGHYTIVAYKDGTREEKGRLSGTITSGTFISSTGQGIPLESGNYRFFCFNDAVAVRSYIPAGFTTPDYFIAVPNWSQDEPLMGMATATITNFDYFVPFNLQHNVWRLRLKVSSSAIDTAPLKASITAGQPPIGGAANQLFFPVNGFDVTAFVDPADAPVPATLNFSTFTAEATPTGNTFTSEYVYFGETGGNYFVLRQYHIDFTGGAIGGTPLVGKSINLANIVYPAGFKNQKNQSITLNIRVKKSILYLMTDGTTGTFDKTTYGGGTKIPIAIVVRQKTATKEGLAVALKHILVGTVGQYDGYLWAADNEKINDVQIPEYIGGDMANDINPAFFEDENGYHYTWDNSPRGIKANNIAYKAFYEAAHYSPGVTITGANVGKWYLPAAGEWKLFVESVADAKWTGRTAQTPKNFDTYFTRVGGDTFGRAYGVSTETTNLIHGTDFWYFGNSVSLSDYFARNRPDIRHYIRPFIHF